MIAGERTTAYINSLDMGNTELLNQIEKEALGNLCADHTTGDAELSEDAAGGGRSRKSILEVGTAIGFSALLMAEYSPADTRLTTIEKYEKRIPIAKENFRRAGRQDQITLLEGDAADILKGLTGTYDFIFMDAAKGQYIHFLPEVFRLLAPGGILLSDNVLQDGDIIESRFAGGTPRPDHSQPYAGVSVYADPSPGSDHIGAAAGRRRDLKRKKGDSYE